MGRKLVKILKQQEYYDDERDYLPGKIDITASALCKPRVVNFFGDIHTEVFSLNVSYDDQYVVVGCSNGDVKVYHIF